jgi:hypothetical protein
VDRTVGQPEMPFAVLIPGVRFEVGVLRVGTRLHLAKYEYPWRNAPLLELIAPQRQLVMVRAEKVRVVRRGAVRLRFRDLSQTADEIEDDSSYP